MTNVKVQMTNGKGERLRSRLRLRGNARCQSSNDKIQMTHNKHEHASRTRPLLALIGPVFVFRGLLSSVSGLVYTVCRPPSSVLMITDTDHEHEGDKGFLRERIFLSSEERVFRDLAIWS